MIIFMSILFSLSFFIKVAAMLIASKYEQCFRYEVRVEDMVYICDRTYSADDVRTMETSILKALEYVVGIPTSYTFLVRYLSVSHRERSAVSCIAAYLLERAMVESTSSEYRPSVLAAAAIDIALRSVEGPTRGWCPLLSASANGLNFSLIRPAVLALEAIVTHGRVLMPTLKAVYRKYAQPRYLSVSVNFTLPPLINVPGIQTTPSKVTSASLKAVTDASTTTTSNSRNSSNAISANTLHISPLDTSKNLNK
jgi:cyclin-A